MYTGQSTELRTVQCLLLPTSHAFCNVDLLGVQRGDAVPAEPGPGPTDVTLDTVDK